MRRYCFTAAFLSLSLQACTSESGIRVRQTGTVATVDASRVERREGCFKSVILGTKINGKNVIIYTSEPNLHYCAAIFRIDLRRVGGPKVSKIYAIVTFEKTPPGKVYIVE